MHKLQEYKDSFNNQRLQPPRLFSASFGMLLQWFVKVECSFNALQYTNIKKEQRGDKNPPSSCDLFEVDQSDLFKSLRR